jgi:hypothetical protein
VAVRSRVHSGWIEVASLPMVPPTVIVISGMPVADLVTEVLYVSRVRCLRRAVLAVTVTETWSAPIGTATVGAWPGSPAVIWSGMIARKIPSRVGSVPTTMSPSMAAMPRSARMPARSSR